MNLPSPSARLRKTHEGHCVKSRASKTSNGKVRSGNSCASKTPSDRVRHAWLRSKAIGIMILGCSVVTGCAVGPNFKRPAAPEVTGYSAQPVSTTASTAGVAGGEAQRFGPGGEISADWWTLFHSAPLNELIEQSLTKNPDLKAAQAALSVAREGVLAQRGAYFPSISADFSASRTQQSGTLAPTPANNALQYNLFTPEVNVSYVPDVFGLNRRTVESLQAQAEAVRFQMIATYNTLTANVVVTAIQQGSVQQQIEATQELIDVETHILRDPALPVLQRATPTGWTSPRRNRSSRRPPPRCRRCRSRPPSCTTSWQPWPGSSPARRRPALSSCRACSSRRICR